jgi:hypothetical protein
LWQEYQLHYSKTVLFAKEINHEYRKYFFRDCSHRVVSRRYRVGNHPEPGYLGIVLHYARPPVERMRFQFPTQQLGHAVVSTRTDDRERALSAYNHLNKAFRDASKEF